MSDDFAAGLVLFVFFAVVALLSHGHIRAAKRLEQAARACVDRGGVYVRRYEFSDYECVRIVAHTDSTEEGE